MKRSLITTLTLLLAMLVLPVVYATDITTPLLRVGNAPATEMVSAEDVQLFPNPVESELNVVSEKYIIERLEIYNSGGELIFSSPMPVPQGSRMTINLNSCPTGYYVVRLSLGGIKRPVSYRIVKK